MADKSNEVNKGGRPPVVLTDDQVIELKALSAVLNKEQLADYFGVSHVTLLAIEERQPEVSLAYKKGRSRAIASIGGNLISQAKSGNVSAAIFYLKTQAGWKETQHIETRDITKEMDEEEINNRIAELTDKK